MTMLIQGDELGAGRELLYSQIRELPCTIYTGELFDNNVAVIPPKTCRAPPAYGHSVNRRTFHVAVRHSTEDERDQCHACRRFRLI